MDKKVVLLTCCYFFIFSFRMEADINDTSIISVNVVNLELGGTGLLYSVNYERVFLQKTAYFLSVRVGFGSYSTMEKQQYTVPVEINTLQPVSRQNHYLEWGLGTTYVQEQSRNAYAMLLASGRVGYRFQQDIAGFFFKISYTPLFPCWADKIFSYKFIHYAGISIGYTFNCCKCFC